MRELTDDKVLRVLKAWPAYTRGWLWVRFLFHRVDPADLEGDELGPIEAWYTYDECVELKIWGRRQHFHLEFSIYNGDLLDGHPKDLRFERTFRLPAKKYAASFKDVAKAVLREAADEAWERHVQSWKEDWMDRF